MPKNEKETQKTNSDSGPLFVVGIGASAGGLPAMIELLQQAICHKAMCFVVVSHLPRYSETELPQILARVTELATQEIRDGMELQHCHIYTIPPNCYVQVVKGRFVVQPRPENVPNNSADYLFESLAREYGSNSIAVVLSGARVGADGAKGVMAIKAAGGHTYAQDPKTATQPSMPLLAIETGCIDSIMNAHAIGEELSLVSWAI